MLKEACAKHGLGDFEIKMFRNGQRKALQYIHTSSYSGTLKLSELKGN